MASPLIVQICYETSNVFRKTDPSFGYDAIQDGNPNENGGCWVRFRDQREGFSSKDRLQGRPVDVLLLFNAVS